MSLAFNTTKMEPSTEGFDKLALLEATENLNQAWMDLTDAQRGMDEVCAIMENIHTSVDLINKFGKDAIPMLNVDGGLEALLQIPENVITAEKAMEGLGDKAKEVWTRFVDAVEAIFAKIYRMVVAFVDWVIKSVGDSKKKLQELKKSILSKNDTSVASHESLDDNNSSVPSHSFVSRYAGVALANCDIVENLCTVYKEIINLAKNTSPNSDVIQNKLRDLNRYISSIDTMNDVRKSSAFDAYMENLFQIVTADQDSIHISYFSGKLSTGVDTKSNMDNRVSDSWNDNVLNGVINKLDFASDKIKEVGDEMHAVMNSGFDKSMPENGSSEYKDYYSNTLRVIVFIGSIMKKIVVGAHQTVNEGINLISAVVPVWNKYVESFKTSR